MTDLTPRLSVTDRHVFATSDPAFEPSPSHIHVSSLFAQSESQYLPLSLPLLPMIGPPLWLLL